MVTAGQRKSPTCFPAFLIDIDQAWVDRLVSILDKQKLVTI